jgi:TPP-dependent pyruvate/acetoin dehydrogenase alpha subunit
VSDLERALTEVRAADARLNAASPQPFPVPIGNLAAIVAGALSALQRGDAWAPGLRERAGATLRGVPDERLIDGFAGARPYHILPPSPSPASRALHAVGWATAHRDRTALVHLGVGSAADGAFHEALNLAAKFGPNVVFLVAVDPLGDGAPLGRQIHAALPALAAAFGIPSASVDGRDAAAVHDAVAAARSAGGPHLIEAKL